MTEKRPQHHPEADDAPRRGESFLARLHRRKTEARQRVQTPSAAPENQAVPAPDADERDAIVELTDADMPPLESLTPDSDYSGFLSSRVSDSLRRAALRKLFHSEVFNTLDGLDDYAEDFTTFSALGDVVTADMRHRLQVELRRQAEALEKVLDDKSEVTAAAEETPPQLQGDREKTGETPDPPNGGRSSRGDT